MGEKSVNAETFLEKYFAFADNKISGFENYLAENVLLDWFGKTIQGRKNVAEFIGIHKVNSKHVFDSVRHVTKIGYL